MRIIKLKGGLGNQMFQYVFAKQIQLLTGEEVKLDYTVYKENGGDKVRKPRILNFNIDLLPAEKEDIKHVCKYEHYGDSLSWHYKMLILMECVFNSKYYFEKNRQYRDVEKILDYYYYDGYWQSWRYVDRVFNNVKEFLVPKCTISEKTLKEIKQCNNCNSVFMGVRKGDYTAEERHYGVFDQAYYDQAMSLIEKKVKNPVYYIFSNDIEWVKSNMNFGNHNIIFRTKNDIVSDFEELMLMASCKHSIIVNSTYHWWGARLNYYPGKLVIAPDKWFSDGKKIDIVPPSWLRI